MSGKRVFDFLCGVTGVLIFSPVLLVTAVAIKMEDGGPIFYRGTRIGQFGRPFRIFKFRTMVPHAERLGGSSTPDDDPRVTRVGRYLRKYKLDELPQLFNVLKGEMSLVGPRPEVEHYVRLFTDEERAILRVKPGITDWASLWNADEGAILAGAGDPERVYLEQIRPKKIQLQLAYVQNQSFAVDCQILWKTVLAVIFRVRPEAFDDLLVLDRKKPYGSR